MAEVSVGLSEFQRQVRQLLDEVERRLERLKAEVRAEAVQAAREEAPVRTGEFRASIDAKGPDDGPVVLSSHPKHVYIIRGTGPSPGRFIPALGKRLTKRSGRRDIGVHPGTPPHPVFERALEKLPGRVRRVIEQVFGR